MSMVSTGSTTDRAGSTTERAGSTTERRPARRRARTRCAARPLVVLTGAGLSTDSGIPDYRGPGSPARRPMTYQEFVSGPEARQRYWARSHLGWGRMKGADPNAGHHALARLRPGLLITQNVDGLHERAGTPQPGRPARPDRRRRLPRLPRHDAAAGPARATHRAQPRLRRPARGGAHPPRRRRRARRHRRLRGAGLRRLRRRPQARRGLLRGERAGAAGAALLRRRGRPAATAAARCSSRARASP